MTKIFASRFSPLAALGFAALALAAAPAEALSSRVFVSGHGTDSAGCGAVTAPCRHFQTAHDNTAAGGEIIVRDSGDYGPVHITKSISIVNDGAGTASVRAASGTNGVTIDGVGPADAVHLRGLSIIEAGFPTSGTGVMATNLGSLTIVNCVARQFADYGIGVFTNSVPASFSISHTIVAENNAGAGILVVTTAAGSAKGVIDHVLVNNNGTGIALDGANVKATIADSILSNNSNGLGVGNAASATVRNVTVSHNGLFGFSFPNGTSRIAHSGATGNTIGVSNSGAVVESFGDNNLRGNPGADVGGSLTPVAPQ